MMSQTHGLLQAYGDLRDVVLDYYYNPLTKDQIPSTLLPVILNSCEFLKINTQTQYQKSILCLNFDSNLVASKQIIKL